jgi:hypothetical protein
LPFASGVDEPLSTTEKLVGPQAAVRKTLTEKAREVRIELA